MSWKFVETRENKGVTVKIDFREVVPALVYYNGKLKRSVTDPGVKEAIYRDIYMQNKGSITTSGGSKEFSGSIYNVPYKTGALYNSPKYESPTDIVSYKNTTVYMQGSIDDDGIHYNPFTVSPSWPGGYHYTDDSGFSPMWGIQSDLSRGQDSIILQIVKKRVMENLKNG